MGQARRSSKYSIIDIETTGMNREGQKIIEIGIINYDGNEIEEVYSSLINPERSISYQIEMITGINNEMVVDAPKFYQVAKKIIEMTEGRIFVAHNVFFDYRFIQREFNELGYQYKREVFCTCKAARQTFLGLASYSLKNLCAHFNIKQKSAHRALSDAEDALEILKLIKQDNPAFHNLSSEADHLIPAQLKNFSFDDYPQTPGLYFMYGENNELLYVGKSLNIQKRLKQHFKQLQGSKREIQLKSEVIKVDFMECFHDLPTSILELHFIKSMKPKYNRAQRRKNFRYGIKKAIDANTQMLSFQVTTQTDGHSIDLLFGSKIHAENFINKMYENLFGVSLFHPHFKEQMNLFAKTLGIEKFNQKMLAHLNKFESHFEDQIIGPLDPWGVTIEGNSIQKIHLSKHGQFKIQETPDMRGIIRKKLGALRS